MSTSGSCQPGVTRRSLPRCESHYTDSISISIYAHHFYDLGLLPCSLLFAEHVLREHDSSEERAHRSARHRADFHHRAPVHLSPRLEKKLVAHTLRARAVVCVSCRHALRPGWRTTVVHMWSMQPEHTLHNRHTHCSAHSDQQGSPSARALAPYSNISTDELKMLGCCCFIRGNNAMKHDNMLSSGRRYNHQRQGKLTSDPLCQCCEYLKC